MGVTQITPQCDFGGKPNYGWSTFKIGESHSYSLSYLTDVACDWLAQAIHGL